MLGRDVAPVVRVGLRRELAEGELDDLPGLHAVCRRHEHVAEPAVVVEADGEHGVGAPIDVPVDAVGAVAAGVHRAGEVGIGVAQRVEEVVTHPARRPRAGGRTKCRPRSRRGCGYVGTLAGIERDDVLAVVRGVAELLGQRQAVLQVDVPGVGGERRGRRQQRHGEHEQRHGDGTGCGGHDATSRDVEAPSDGASVPPETAALLPAGAAARTVRRRRRAARRSASPRRAKATMTPMTRPARAPMATFMVICGPLGESGTAASCKTRGCSFCCAESSRSCVCWMLFERDSCWVAAACASATQVDDAAALSAAEPPPLAMSASASSAWTLRASDAA